MTNDPHIYDASDTSAFLDHIYSVSVDPVRMVDLVESWERQVAADDNHNAEFKSRKYLTELGGRGTAVEALDRVISAHASHIAELLAGFRTAALIFNKRGLIVASNDAATTTFNIMPGHRLDDLNIDPIAYEVLQDQISQLVADKDCGNAIVRFQRQGTSHKVLAHLRAIDAEASGRHVIMVTSEHNWPDSLSELLEKTYGITKHEAVVLQSITRGETVAEIAITRKRSEDTIRSQVKSLLQKTALSSQAELVRLTTTLLHSIGDAVVDDANSKAIKRLSLYVLTRFALPDGRSIHYRLVGSPRGRPFLLLPSGQGFIKWTDEAELELERRNLQMIVPIRAGYGPSSTCPIDENIYDVAADDVIRLVGHLGVKSCPVVALCDDIKIALHTEIRHPGIFTSIIGAAATMPLSTPAQFARLTKFVRYIQTNATYAPRTLPYVSLLFFHMARRLGTRRFLETMMGNCLADVSALQNPEIARPLEASTEIVITRHFMAHNAWSREIVEFAKPWATLLLKTRTPIKLLAGIGDPFSPIATVREYCKAKPSIELTEVPDAGQTLVYTHHRLVLDAVEAAMAV